MSLTEHEAATGLSRLEAPVAALSLQPREAVLQAVREGSEPRSTYWLMNALATVIACYGLLANSAAVVIGAMVVAMLLGPISGVALGLNEGDKPLLRTAARSLIGGILWILAIVVTVGFIHRDAPLTNEILSRTDARLFDLIIGLAGGAAGAVAVLSPRSVPPSSGLPSPPPWCRRSLRRGFCWHAPNPNLPPARCC